jgi:aerotaxis receptor
VRISGHSATELIGESHNIIRHPDMPRAVFRLLWERIKAGHAVAALVKNLAKDGCYYWVVALISPAPKGFLSVRFKPTGASLTLVEPLYAQMLAAEKVAQEGGAEPKMIMDAGASVLQEGLRAHKFADYDAFMWVVLCDELKSRDAVLAREKRSILRALPEDRRQRESQNPALKRLAAIHDGGWRAYGHLNRLYRRLDDFVMLNETLGQKSAFVNNLTTELRISSINVALASTRAGGEGQALGVISRHMGESSGEVAVAVHSLVSGIGILSGRLRGVIFSLASARLQVEMVLSFLHELICSEAGAGAWPERRDLIHALHKTFATTMGQTSLALHQLHETVHPLATIAQDLERLVLSLQVAQVGGVVESTRLSSQEGFLNIFAGIRQQVDRTHAELRGLGEALDRLDNLADESPPIAREIEKVAARMEGDIGLLADLAGDGVTVAEVPPPAHAPSRRLAVPCTV